MRDNIWEGLRQHVIAEARRSVPTAPNSGERGGAIDSVILGSVEILTRKLTDACGDTFVEPSLLNPP
jgi:hypothetical protein